MSAAPHKLQDGRFFRALSQSKVREGGVGMGGTPTFWGRGTSCLQHRNFWTPPPLEAGPSNNLSVMDIGCSNYFPIFSSWRFELQDLGRRGWGCKPCFSTPFPVSVFLRVTPLSLFEAKGHPYHFLGGLKIFPVF